MKKRRTKWGIAVYADGRPAKEIARLAGISESYLSLIVNGHVIPRLETAMSLACILSVSTNTVEHLPHNIEDILKERGVIK